MHPDNRWNRSEMIRIASERIGGRLPPESYTMGVRHGPDGGKREAQNEWTNVRAREREQLGVQCKL